MAESFEVPQPILNSPFEEPAEHWFIREGEPPQKRPGRRPALVYPPRDERPSRAVPWTVDGTLQPSEGYAPAYEMALVNLIRRRLQEWKAQGCPGVTRTTKELLDWWHRERDEESKRQFFAQQEAVETVIFLTEARADFRQGIVMPRDEPSDEQRAAGHAGFLRYACKMATGPARQR
jgi:type III restriction enzyme